MREKYIQMRKTSQYDLNWFYQYHQQKWDEKKHKFMVPIQQFYQLFNIYFQAHANDILNNLDKEFEVQKIEDKEGKIIYIK